MSAGSLRVGGFAAVLAGGIVLGWFARGALDAPVRGEGLSGTEAAVRDPGPDSPSGGSPGANPPGLAGGLRTQPARGAPAVVPATTPSNGEVDGGEADLWHSSEVAPPADLAERTQLIDRLRSAEATTAAAIRERLFAWLGEHPGDEAVIAILVRSVRLGGESTWARRFVHRDDVFHARLEALESMDDALAVAAAVSDLERFVAGPALEETLRQRLADERTRWTAPTTDLAALVRARREALLAVVVRLRAGHSSERVRKRARSAEGALVAALDAKSD